MREFAGLFFDELGCLLMSGAFRDQDVRLELSWGQWLVTGVSRVFVWGL
jgi:hypothetical protein